MSPSTPHEAFFCDLLHNFPERGEQLDLDPGLKIYAEGYWTRLTQTPCHTILERLVNVCDAESVKQWLMAFYQDHPPRERFLLETLEGFPNWLSEHHAEPIVCDLATLCLERWRVLVGPDPEELCVDAGSLHDIYLNPAHSWLDVTTPLWSLWSLAEKPITESLSLSDESEPVLLFKSSPISLELLPIPLSCRHFVGALSRGFNLGQAFDRMAEDTQDAALEALVETLTERKAWVVNKIS